MVETLVHWPETGFGDVAQISPVQVGFSTAIISAAEPPATGGNALAATLRLTSGAVPRLAAGAVGIARAGGD